MARNTKVVGFSVPPATAAVVRRMATEDGRSRSELFREMVRVYQRYRAMRADGDEKWITRLIREAEAEERERRLPVGEALAESRRLARYGARRARERRIRPEDIDRVIHAFRGR